MEKNKVYLLDVNLFLDRIGDCSVDLIIADPPYNIGISKWDFFKNEKEYWKFMYSWINKSIQKLKVGGSIYIFNNQINSAITLCYLLKKKMTFNNWITWYKKDGFHPTKKHFVNNQETILFFSKGPVKTFNYDQVRMPYISKKRIFCKNGMKGKNGKIWFPNSKGKLCTDVWEISSERHKVKKKGRTIKLFHPTVKPTDIINRIIKASSKKNEMILDLFFGSGQTSIIAQKLKRYSLGCDINKKYFIRVNKLLSNG